MNQKEVFKKTGGIIRELSDQYEYLKTVNDDLNDLELELFVANAHFLTDHIEVLYKLNLQNRMKKKQDDKQETPREERYFEPVVQRIKPPEKIREATSKELPEADESGTNDTEKLEYQPVPVINLKVESPADSYSFIREEPETIRHELVLDEAMDINADEKTVVENEMSEDTVKQQIIASAPIEEINQENTDEKAAEFEKRAEAPVTLIVDEVLTINQKMSSQSGDKGMARPEQLNVKPISDIKLAVTLNDKLLYVNDLFNGYNLAYSEAIEILNRFNSFEEALRFLKTNYIAKNNWDSKPATVERFYALLKRRYA